MSKAHPRVFISYSWTSDEYRRTVMILAERLVHDGVDVIIDEWDLNPGHDTHAFMERCVTDETIDKVLILCNRRYADRANKREGNVGIETSVITDRVYGQANQEKFIPVVMERGEGGETFRPAYLKTRKYIDLSGGVQRGDYEGLLRCIYGKPRRAKPPLGPTPSWLDEGRGINSSRMLVSSGARVVMHDKPVAYIKDAAFQETGAAPTDKPSEYDQVGLKDVADALRKEEAGKAAEVPVKSQLSEYDWAELKRIADKIAGARSDDEGLEVARRYNLVGADGRLGDERTPVTLAGGGRAEVRIAGFRHDELVGGSGRKAGITFEFADVPVAHAMNSSRTNEGGWKASDMAEYLNGEFLGLLPEELRSGIVQVKKLTNNKGYVGRNDASAVNATEDKLWLLSMVEVYGRVSDQKSSAPSYPAVYNAEGTQYKLYSDHGVSTANHVFCKKQNGGVNAWWSLRSPFANSWDDFLDIDTNGCFVSTYAGLAAGVSPGFCF